LQLTGGIFVRLSERYASCQKNERRNH
jgi:hypothetical protein